MAGGWESQPQIPGGAGGGGQKQFNPGGAAKRRQQPAPPPVLVPNSSGNYSTPSRPPVASQGAIPQISAPPSIGAYLGKDTTYMHQQQQYHKTLADFLANTKMQRSKIGEDFGSANRAMGLQKTHDLAGIQDDYASRGLLSSGLYAGAVGDYNTDFEQKLAELLKNRDRSFGDLSTSETQFRRQQALEEQAAREAAIRRRATQYGI